MSSIIIVDDDENICKLFRRILIEDGHDVEVASSAAGLRSVLKTFLPDLVLLDVNLPDARGHELVPEILMHDPYAFVIVISGEMTVDTAIESTKKGAFDYLSKPFTKSSLLHTVDQALNARKYSVGRAADERSEQHIKLLRTNRLAGSSRLVCSVNLLIDRLSKNNVSPIMITGEAGTEKYQVAKSLHDLSPRHESPFIVLKSASVPRPILSTELFGGSFHPSETSFQRQNGVLELAKGGTLFIDEITSFDTKTLERIEKFLSTKMVEYPDGNTRIVNTNLLIGSDHDLEDLVTLGEFPRSLFRKLSEHRIHLPPLRERLKDIEEISLLILQEVNFKYGKSLSRISQDVLSFFAQYTWPGNMDELYNFLERLAILASDEEIYVDYGMVRRSFFLPDGKSASAHGSSNIPHPTDEEVGQKSLSSIISIQSDNPEEEFLSLEMVEREYLRLILRQTSFDVNRTARILGLSVSALNRKMNIHNLTDWLQLKQKTTSEVT